MIRGSIAREPAQEFLLEPLFFLIADQWLPFFASQVVLWERTTLIYNSKNSGQRLQTKQEAQRNISGPKCNHS